MTDNEMIAQIDYDRFHKIACLMFHLVTPPERGRKVPLSERVK